MTKQQIIEAMQLLIDSHANEIDDICVYWCNTCNKPIPEKETIYLNRGVISKVLFEDGSNFVYMTCDDGTLEKVDGENEPLAWLDENLCQNDVIAHTVCMTLNTNMIVINSKDSKAELTRWTRYGEHCTCGECE